MSMKKAKFKIGDRVRVSNYGKKYTFAESIAEMMELDGFVAKDRLATEYEAKFGGIITGKCYLPENKDIIIYGITYPGLPPILIEEDGIEKIDEKEIAAKVAELGKKIFEMKTFLVGYEAEKSIEEDLIKDLYKLTERSLEIKLPSALFGDEDHSDCEECGMCPKEEENETIPEDYELFLHKTDVENEEGKKCEVLNMSYFANREIFDVVAISSEDKKFVLFSDNYLKWLGNGAKVLATDELVHFNSGMYILDSYGELSRADIPEGIIFNFTSNDSHGDCADDNIIKSPVNDSVIIFPNLTQS